MPRNYKDLSPRHTTPTPYCVHFYTIGPLGTEVRKRTRYYPSSTCMVEAGARWAAAKRPKNCTNFSVYVQQASSWTDKP